MFASLISRDIFKYLTLFYRTETGPLGLLTVSNDRSNWEYMMFDDMYRYFFKPIDGKVKEMIVLVGSGLIPAPYLIERIYQPSECAPCVINHRDPEGFSTSDLWEQHPEKPHLWRIVGRTNDIVCNFTQLSFL
jgi:hypothetical protein